MKKEIILFYTVSVIGFFFPYVLNFLLSSTNAEIKIFAMYALSKFNIIYFAVVIVFFFTGLFRKFQYIRIAQIIFITAYIGYVFIDYFALAKLNVENYIKTHHLNAKLVKISDLEKYPNFKIYYKKANWAAVKILPETKKELPFNYKKDRAQ
jgi:hypothetical protein